MARFYNPPAYNYDYITVNFNSNNKFYSQATNLSHDQIIQKIEQNKPIILDFTRDHAHLSSHQSIHTIKSYMDSLGYTNIFYLTTNKFEDTGDRIVFFPVWLYSKSIAYSNLNTEVKPVRSYILSCLNRYPSVHRVYLFYLLMQKSYYQDSIISFYGLRNPYDPQDTGRPDSIDNPMYDELSAEVRQDIKKLNMYKESIPGDNAWDGDHTYNHIAYNNTYLNIITESTANYPFFSEKTCKPLAAGQLFLSLNGSNHIDILRSLGFDVYDDLFNSHMYDKHDGFKDRIHHLLDLIDTVYENIEPYFIDNYSRIINNKNYFISSAFRNNLLKALVDRDLSINIQ